MVLPREELLGSINLLDKDLVGTVSFNGARATSAANPVDNQDLATKLYVDSFIGASINLENTLALGNTTGANDIIITDGSDIQITSGDFSMYYNPAATAGASGSVTLTAQNGTGVNGGSFTINAGDATGAGTPGDININPGLGATGYGAAVVTGAFSASPAANSQITLLDGSFIARGGDANTYISLVPNDAILNSTASSYIRTTTNTFTAQASATATLTLEPDDFNVTTKVGSELYLDTGTFHVGVQPNTYLTLDATNLIVSPLVGTEMSLSSGNFNATAAVGTYIDLNVNDVTINPGTDMHLHIESGIFDIRNGTGFDQIIANGTQMLLQTRAATGGAPSTPINIYTGDVPSVGNDSGRIRLETGSGDGGGAAGITSGNIEFLTGAMSGLLDTSGAITMETGAAQTSGNVSIASGGGGSVISGAVSIFSGGGAATTGDVTISSGSGALTGDTGSVTLASGNGTVNPGTKTGDVTVSSGIGSFDSGNTYIRTGTATVDSGEIVISTGNATAESGAITITTGTGAIGGDITLEQSAAATPGSINLLPGQAVFIADSLSIPVAPPVGGIELFSDSSVLNCVGSFTIRQTNGQLRLQGSSAANYLALQADPTQAVQYTLTMPPVQGSANQTLVNDGSGNMSWQDTETLLSGSVLAVDFVKRSGAIETSAYIDPDIGDAGAWTPTNAVIGGTFGNRTITSIGGENYVSAATVNRDNGSYAVEAVASPVNTDWIVLGTTGGGSARAWFDITNGVVGSTAGAGVIDTSITLTDGYYVCRMLVNDSASNARIWVSRADGDLGSDAADEIIIHGIRVVQNKLSKIDELEGVSPSLPVLWDYNDGVEFFDNVHELKADSMVTGFVGVNRPCSVYVVLERADLGTIGTIFAVHTNPLLQLRLYFDGADVKWYRRSGATATETSVALNSTARTLIVGHFDGSSLQVGTGATMQAPVSYIGDEDPFIPVEILVGGDISNINGSDCIMQGIYVYYGVVDGSAQDIAIRQHLSNLYGITA